MLRAGLWRAKRRSRCWRPSPTNRRARVSNSSRQLHWRFHASSSRGCVPRRGIRDGGVRSRAARRVSAHAGCRRHTLTRENRAVPCTAVSRNAGQPRARSLARCSTARAPRWQGRSSMPSHEASGWRSLALTDRDGRFRLQGVPHGTLDTHRAARRPGVRAASSSVAHECPARSRCGRSPSNEEARDVGARRPDGAGCSHGPTSRR